MTMRVESCEWCWDPAKCREAKRCGATGTTVTGETLLPVDYVQLRLKCILKYPDMWGPAHAVELQTLLLVEMWHVVKERASKEHILHTSRRWASLIERAYPGPPTLLASRLGLAGDSLSSEPFVRMLREFVMGETGLTAEDLA